MGKPTGFKDFTRALPNKLPVAERVKHYQEFVDRMPEQQLKEQSAR